MDYGVRNPAPTADTKEAKRRFSRLGLGAFVILLVTLVVSSIASGVIAALNPALIQNQIVFWLLNAVPLYAIGIPVGLLVIRRVPREPLEQGRMSLGRWIGTAIICIFLMYLGNLVGVLVTTFLNDTFGLNATNPLEQLLTGESWLPQILVTVIAAPIAEEFVFRRLMIDRMHIYGERLAVVTSAVMFGLFHGNLCIFDYEFVVEIQLMKYRRNDNGDLIQTLIARITQSAERLFVQCLEVNSL